MTDNFDKIEAYLFGQLNATEKAAFEEALQRDATLATEVNLHRLEHRAMEQQIQTDLRAQMADWKLEKEEMPEQKSGKVIEGGFSMKKILRYAAALAVLVTAGIFTYNQFNNLDSATLASNYMSETVESVKAIQRSSEKDSLVLTEGLAAMQAKEYAQAAQLFGSVVDVDYKELATLLQAKAYFKAENYTASELTLKQATQMDLSPEFADKVEWNLTLTLLAKNGKKDAEFLRLIRKIAADENHSFTKKANDLLNEL